MQSQTTELQVFAGGLNLQAAPHLIKREEARYLSNANIRNLNLAPLLSPLFVQEASDNFMFYFNDNWHYFPLWRNNVLYNGKWYWTDGRTPGKMDDEGNVLPLGIAPPTDRPTIAPTAPSADSEGLTGNIQYVYTYYDVTSGSESPPSPPSITLDLVGADANQAVAISALIPSVDGFATRIYRLGGNITAYSAVVTLEEGEVTYTDELGFTQIQGMILSTTRAYPPPTVLINLTQHQGRFFGSVDSKLYFTPLGKPDSWFLLDFIGFDTAIIGVVSVANGLIVTLTDTTWLISGNNAKNLTKHLLSNSEGCLSNRSISVNDGTAIWLSGSGFVMSNGSSITNISLNIIGGLATLDPAGSAFLDKRYFMSFNATLAPSDDLYPNEELYPGSAVSNGGSALPVGAILIDFSMGQPAFSTITDSSMKDLHVSRNELYQISSQTPELKNLITEDDIYNILSEDGRFNIIGTEPREIALAQSLKGQDFRELDYISPLLTDGSIGSLKQYEKVRITFVGDCTVSVYTDNRVLLQTANLSNSARDSQWIGIPVENNRGYGIQFRITGKVIVDSIMYTWTPKEIL